MDAATVSRFPTLLTRRQLKKKLTDRGFFLAEQRTEQANKGERKGAALFTPSSSGSAADRLSSFVAPSLAAVVPSAPVASSAPRPVSRFKASRHGGTTD